jgi:hypothetical protein
MKMSSKNSALAVKATLALAFLTAVTVSGAEKPAVTFEGKDTLLRPKEYRDWIFVGSSLGLRYDKDPEKESPSKTEHFSNVYINPASYREFTKTGKFADGTVLLLEVATLEAKKEPGLQGSYQKEFVRLEAAVKDSKRFENSWAYFSFTEAPGKLKEKAQPFAKNACYDCHQQKAATDNVFTQFYPVLRAVAQK